ncbi:hypothetical protein CEP54_008973 [Fusarium duplospermum]|uniref:Heterokaryon incompatibility domain-containing protein n=1 Tax=Fusarium duplospermum TaxID=1325734 RepID=A0A428PT05_9HYPO|nr:hypothetical protein CEP54_008973 [Fusarium duplospermum]
MALRIDTAKGDLGLHDDPAKPAVDFQMLIYASKSSPGPDDPSPNSPLGTLKDIISRSDKCPVCNLIVDSLRERHKKTPREHFADVFYGRKPLPENGEEEVDPEVEEYDMRVTWGDTDIKCSIEPQFFCEVWEDFENVRLAEKKHDFFVHRLLLTLEPNPYAVLSFMATDWVRLHAIWSKEDSSDSPGKFDLNGRLISPQGSGRQVGEHLDISLVKGWLDKCEKEHGDKCCNPPWLAGSDDSCLEPFRAIDVKERRIVNLPSQSRYIALSYVWGASSQTPEQQAQRRLTSDNSSRLTQVNGLDELSLPKTVGDAMEFTSKMGERYLWVDALCIIQDDIKDLSHQTSRMDLVYSRALFTIIAACGDDSESGLSGLPGRERDIFNRSVRLSPEGFHLAPTAGLFVNAPLERSTWNSRGWTFQERILSRRIMVFTPSQVFWICEDAMWDEEVILELPKPRVRVESLAFGCNDEWDDRDPKFTSKALVTYIMQFSMREFTFSADVLPAFLGVVRRYEHLNNEVIHWGIPTQLFDQSLVWKAGTERRKEKHRFVCGDSEVREVPYPSWSWLGWTGSIGPILPNHKLWGETNMGKKGAGLLFYALLSDGQVRLVEGLGQAVDSGLRWKGETVVKGPIATDDLIISKMESFGISEENTHVTPAYDTGRLVFWTSHAVVNTKVGEEKLLIQLQDEALELKASFSQSFQAALHRKEDTPSSKTAGETQSMDLIFISRFYEIADAEETGKLNVLVVEQSVPDSGIWSRIGVAVVEETDWVRLEPNWEMVILG